MMMLRPRLMVFILFSAAFMTCVSARSVAGAPYPPAVQQLVDQGVRIAGSFKAPDGLTGYVGEMQGQPVAFYLTPGGEHVIVGPMLSASGENLTEAKVQELVVGPKNAKAWRALEKAEWVREGSAGAPVIVYTFTDPNCPFCHRFHRAARPWIEAGRVQLRHILVGIIKQDSLPKAATILGAEDPGAALRENQEKYGSGGIAVVPKRVEAYSDTIRENNALMSSLDLHATPSTYYKGPNGQIFMKQGAPDEDELVKMMGGPRP
ncbi:thiol:disulfide interchange protein DsbG [Microbulbifer thermotolerans]|uniref:thiol:disulfide interchange protein DsbG n=1 Tax=Microbulbifer thermotolerans TaxID=252514 RepID=UPI002248DEFC|nr:thiol:disulfide interchange protein DsbG [Microbulbifer thermotolerans]